VRLRIISGQFGGRFLDAPDNSRTHPMGERIRGSLFNILGDISGQTALDAFAGTGAIGLEALSRGAAEVTFIEKDRIAANVIAKNISFLGVDDQSKLVRTSLSNWMKTSENNKYDLVFADPPFHDLQLSTVKQLAAYLKPKGLMILSLPGRESAPTVNGVVVVDNRSYGDAALAFYRHSH
jgi:16S rRNA (guanine966-N2)-methyltransferase